MAERRDPRPRRALVDAYNSFLSSQLARKVERLPHFQGLVVDRSDWMGVYSNRADDGISWARGRPARSMKAATSKTSPRSCASSSGPLPRPMLMSECSSRETNLRLHAEKKTTQHSRCTRHCIQTTDETGREARSELGASTQHDGETTEHRFSQVTPSSGALSPPRRRRAPAGAASGPGQRGLDPRRARRRRTRSTRRVRLRRPCGAARAGIAA